MSSIDPHDLKRTDVGGKASGKRLARIVEYSVAVFITAMAVAIHVRFFLNAGGLWRDEITSVNLASTEPLGRAIGNLYHDSFPVLWLLVVRLWERSGIGASDQGLRVLGLIAGLSIVAVLWRNARRFGRSVPVISVALLSLTSAVTCFGDSIRAYGLGMFLGLLMMGLIWEMTRKETLGAFIFALIAALLSVHMLFYNCVLLLAACCGAIAVTLPKKQWKRCGWVIAVGLICAGSMLIYLPMFHHTNQYMMFRGPLSYTTLMYASERSLGFGPDRGVPFGYNAIVWATAIVVGLLGAGMMLWVKDSKSKSREGHDAVVFCGVQLLVGVLAYAAFLKILSYRLQPWYFLAAMAMVAGSVEGLFAAMRSVMPRVCVAVCTVAFALIAAGPVWDDVGIRRTNVDLIADQLGQWAAQGDVIVIVPWNFGGTFVRYYHGPAEVTAVPPVSSLAYQHYDLMTKFLGERNAMDPLIVHLSDVLRAGHRVWVVGDGDFPTDPPPAQYFQESPDPVYGWLLASYQRSWQDEVLYALQRDSREVLTVKIEMDQPSSRFETASLSMVDGWTGDAGGYRR